MYTGKHLLFVALVLALAGCSSDAAPARVRGPGTGTGVTAGGSSLVGGGAGTSGSITNPTGTLLSTAGTGTTIGPISDPNVCASAQVTATRVTPTVYLVLDGSSSMETQFGGMGSRWSVLRDSLVGSSGVVTKLESVVKFGMSIYSNNDSTKCPAMTEVAPSLMNLMTMTTAFPAMDTGGGTPTGEALQHVVDNLPDYSNLGPDAMKDPPPIIILATDGEPNGCSAGAACDWVDWANCLGMLLTQLSNAAPTYDSTFAAVRAAHAKNVPVWVISLADGLNSIPDLQKTANIGAGLADDASPGATIYSPQNTDDLTQTLTKLIGNALSCDVTLAGTLVVNRACEGTVKMNGQALTCNDDQGWKPVDSTHIALQGAACDRFKSDPTVLLDARFPCDVVQLK
jgi:hypothetical protein